LVIFFAFSENNKTRLVHQIPSFQIRITLQSDKVNNFLKMKRQRIDNDDENGHEFSSFSRSSSKIIPIKQLLQMPLPHNFSSLCKKDDNQKIILPVLPTMMNKHYKHIHLDHRGVKLLEPLGKRLIVALTGPGPQVALGPKRTFFCFFCCFSADRPLQTAKNKNVKRVKNKTLKRRNDHICGFKKARAASLLRAAGINYELGLGSAGPPS
jgi:hypothetical protein